MTDLCATHASEPAIGRCATCSRPYCRRCLVEDVASELAFCSESCRVRRRYGALSFDPSNEFIAALHRPIRTGWKLAAQQLGAISLWVGVPIGIAYGVLRSLTIGDRWNEATSVSGVHEMGFLVCLALGAAAVGVLLSSGYRGEPPMNPWPQVAQRILPWSMVWILFGIAVLAGTLLLIIPGIIIGARLFWADEFVLIHRHSPTSAISESLHLTRGLTGRIFRFQFILGLAEYVMLIPLLIGLVAIFTAAESLEPGPIATVMFSTLFSVLLTGFYATLHAPEIVYFYGLRALRDQLPERALRGDWVRAGLKRSHAAGS